MNHRTRRNSPHGVEARIKAENAAKGIAPLAENVAYDAAREEFASRKEQRAALAAKKRKRDAAVKARGYDPERYDWPLKLGLDR